MDHSDYPMGDSTPHPTPTFGGSLKRSKAPGPVSFVCFLQRRSQVSLVGGGLTEFQGGNKPQYLYL